MGSHLPWGDPRRGWDFVSTGHGDVPWEQYDALLRTRIPRAAELNRAVDERDDMLDFAMKVCLHSHEIGDADFEALYPHGFDDEDIWDIAAITAFFGLSNRMANLTSMRPNDEFYLMGRLPKAPKPAAP